MERLVRAGAAVIHLMKERFLRGFVVGAAVTWAVGAALTRRPEMGSLPADWQPPQPRPAGPGSWVDADCQVEHRLIEIGVTWRLDRVRASGAWFPNTVRDRWIATPGACTQVDGNQEGSLFTFHQHWVSDDPRLGLPVR